jgi:glycosyltransferase involved in cell wall biosynthesis
VSRPLRIGIDCRTILDPDAGERAGVGHYTYHLVRALLRTPTDHHFTLFMDDHAAPRFREEFAEHGHAEVRTLPYGGLGRMIPFFRSHAIIADAFRRAKLDLLHAPANVVPLFYRGRTVVTVHDLAIYGHPEWFPTPFPGAQTFSTRIGVPYAVEHAAAVIAVSNATKRDVVARFTVPEERVTVVHEGVEMPSPPENVLEVQAHARAMGRFGIEPEQYVLSLGTIEPRKNLETAGRAFAAFVAEDYAARKDLVYVVAGAKGWKFDGIFTAMQEANAELIELKRRHGDVPRAPIRHVGYVTAEEKDALYTHAAAFLFPSWEEGFGLPALEAMAYGLPVVASDTSSLPEVCGDSALLVPPGDVRAMQKALSDLWTDEDLPYDLSERAMARASAFTWHHAALDTLRVYGKAMQG